MTGSIPTTGGCPERAESGCAIGDGRFCMWSPCVHRCRPRILADPQVDPAGVKEAGTVYSVQGFEVSHVGVIVGPDLFVHGGPWVAQPQRNFSNSLRRQPPHVALPYIKRIYRTLLSRGMQSCSVFCTDEETQAYFQAHLLDVSEVPRGGTVSYDTRGVE